MILLLGLRVKDFFETDFEIRNKEKIKYFTSLENML